MPVLVDDRSAAVAMVDIVGNLENHGHLAAEWLDLPELPVLTAHEPARVVWHDLWPEGGPWKSERLQVCTRAHVIAISQSQANQLVLIKRAIVAPGGFQDRNVASGKNLALRTDRGGKALSQTFRNQGSAQPQSLLGNGGNLLEQSNFHAL